MVAISVEEKLWTKLVRLAQQKRRRPGALAQEALQEYLQRQSDEEILSRSVRAASKATFPIEATERLIQKHRQRKNAR